jgi:protein-L-isoaspartate(D-aspartate) O-methyltransferase
MRAIGILGCEGPVMDPSELDIVRRAYAKQVMAAAGIDDQRVEAAYAAVRREDFLGPGPWPVLRSRTPAPRYVTTPSADPVYLHVNGVIGILPERNLNNGEPSLHAALLASAAPQSGEHVVHIGAEVGYYTAIMAQLVGSSGAVTGIEFDASLAARAAANVSHLPNAFLVKALATPGPQCTDIF